MEGTELTTTPPSNMHPTIVVPVLVALGRGTPLACNAALRVWLEKSKPGIVVPGARGALFQVVSAFFMERVARYYRGIMSKRWNEER